MGLRAGYTNNPKGRPMNVPNKTTSQMKGLIINVLDNNMDKLQQELKSMSGKDFVEMYLKMAALVLPKPTEERSEGNPGAGLLELVKANMEAGRKANEGGLTTVR